MKITELLNEAQHSVLESQKRCMQCGMPKCSCPAGSCKCKPIKGWIPGKGFAKEDVAEARHENFDDLYGSLPDLRKDKKTGKYHLVHSSSDNKLVLHQDGRFKPLSKDGEAYIKRMTGGEKLDELSPQTLASYKRKAGKQASELDKRAFHKDTEPEQAKRDITKANKRFSGIVRATKKEFGK